MSVLEHKLSSKLRNIYFHSLGALTDDVTDECPDRITVTVHMQAYDVPLRNCSLTYAGR